MFTKIIILSLGGAIGTVLRYGLSGAVHNLTRGVFPYGTLTVNLVGCLVIGLLWGTFERFAFSPQLRLFVFVGVLGGFTTFSSFGLETFGLLRDGELRLGLWNMLLSNVFGIALVYLGFVLSRYIIGWVK